jgi:cytoskeletal protein RodZ
MIVTAAGVEKPACPRGTSMDIGGALHEARERRGLTLQQISDATKISTGILGRIERNEFARLPGSVFTRGYLRAYAGAVGISSEPLVQAYAVQTNPAPVVEPRSAPQARRPQRATTWRIRVPVGTIRDLKSSWPLVVTTAATLAVIVILYGAVTTRSSNPSAASPANADAASARAETDGAPAATTGSDSTAATGTSGQQAPAFPATLAMHFTKECWVGLTADGQSIVYRLVQPGETITARAETEMVVRIGDPTAFTYTLNGTPGRPVGKPGMPVRFRISRETSPGLIGGGAAVAGAVRP